MFGTIREAFAVIHQVIGVRNTVVLAVLFLVAAPFIFAAFILSLPFLLIGTVGSWILNTVQGVGKRLDDPVFGPVIYQGSSTWQAERDLKRLGGVFSIYVTAPRASGPGPAQHELLRALIERQEEIRRQVEQSLYRHYQLIQPDMHEAEQSRHTATDLTTSYLEMIPALEEPTQIWAHLSEGSITLEDQPGCFMISWTCTWDPVYAVTTTFVNWKLEEEGGG